MPSASQAGASSNFYFGANDRLLTVNLPDANIGEMHRYGDDVVLERRTVFGTPRSAGYIHGPNADQPLAMEV